MSPISMKELFNYCSLTNNSGITGAESKGYSDPSPLMKGSKKLAYNKVLRRSYFSSGIEKR